MKVLLVNNGFPSKENPNYTTYIKSIQDCLESAGLETETLVIAYDKPITKSRKILKYISFWFKCFFYKLKEYDYIYINHLPYCWPLVFNHSLSNDKVIIHWHGNELVGKSTFLRLTHRIIKNKLNKYRHFVPSKYFKSQLTQIFKIVQDKINVSPSGGIDTNLFYPHAKNYMNNKITIGYAGGLISSKGADVLGYLIENTNEIEKRTGKEITYKFINYGEDAKKYISHFQAQKCNLNINEKMEKSKMPDFYNSIDLLIFPSKGESLGLVALEAMSCGVPVVSYNLCAFPEFILPGITGEMVEFTKDRETRNASFLSAVCKVIANQKDYMPKKNILDHYSSKAVSNNYKNILN